MSLMDNPRSIEGIRYSGPILKGYTWCQIFPLVLLHFVLSYFYSEFQTDAIVTSISTTNDISPLKNVQSADDVLPTEKDTVILTVDDVME